MWAVDSDSAAKWKIRKNEHFEKMIRSRLNEKMAHVIVEVVDKVGYQPLPNSTWSQANSSVTSHVDQDPVCPPFHAEGGGDTFTSAEELEQHAELVDWSQLTIISDPEQDGEPYVLADVETLFEAMGFKAADERVAQAIEEEIAIPVIPEDVLHDMNEAGVVVHDNEHSEPMLDWDRDNPPMSVGTVYPCMVDFRLAVRQHSIVTEFELGTNKSDTTRFRGHCKARGCPWVIRARTQSDGCVRVQLLTRFYKIFFIILFSSYACLLCIYI